MNFIYDEASVMDIANHSMKKVSTVIELERWANLENSITIDLNTILGK